jgi:trimethylamine:corrinoid methyltransferase-like protein
MPGLFNREPLEHWKAAKGQSLFTSLNQRVREVLAGHEVPEIEAPVRREIDKILRRREKPESA